MTQTHYAQFGTFHITTNTKNGVPWLTLPEVPQILIDNLVMTKNLKKTKIFAFNILPTHMHIILSVMEKRLSEFMHSFKRNAMRDIRRACSNARSGRSLSSAPTTSNIVEQINARSGRSLSSAPTTSNIVEQINARSGRSLSSAPTTSEIIDQIKWQKSFHDEHIQSPQQLANAIRYVQYNAYNHQLVENPYDWDWSSLQFPNLIDEMDIWMD
ncbi:transposase [Patescibacteria group bacterium]|nr:transposase [Patescibacteria group bacterium]